MRKKPILYIVIPCFNEEAVLPITSTMFLEKINELTNLGKISPQSKILFVDDGSKDKTWEIIKDLAENNNKFLGIRQSRNRGHQNSLLAGLMEAKEKCDITISIDCDGQDDIDTMNKMVDEYLDGSEVVYGVRSKRETDTAFKRITAEEFYKFMKLMGAEIVFNHADYRLVSSKVLNELENYKEVNIFLRGMIPLVGFKSTSVYYERSERIAGESHYPLKKMVALALNGITSLSIKPIRIVTCLGFCVTIISFGFLIWALFSKMFGVTVSGWTSMVSIISMLGGIQLLSLGVIGEYVGKIYLETKARPRYIISERTTRTAPKRKRKLDESKVISEQ